MPALEQGLRQNGLSTGTNIFIKLGRVGSMDAVTELLGCQVTLILLGERPGLVTNESLSCYMTYKGYTGISESARTVVSNIFRGGTPPAEAGAYIAEIAKKMITNKASGLDLK
jgi:ethanolamine ammonia-lyase small subunit